MSRLPVVLLHGYSASATSLETWRARLAKAGHEPTAIHLAQYVSLSNEITIKDIAEGFDRALREYGVLGEFDAIVHSTGMLVIREWLRRYEGRARRVRHLVGLAPATFGSPMAHKGRSFLGALFKGERELGPDFLEAGDLVLAGLELGSAYTWNLAHDDLLADPPAFGPGPDSPLAFNFIGLDSYGGLADRASGPGTDGTVRWSGAGFQVRKLVVDLTEQPDADGRGGRFSLTDWRGGLTPLRFVEGVNHATIMSAPPRWLVEAVLAALETEDWADFDDWTGRFPGAPAPTEFAQFVTQARDERGDPITDYFLDFVERDDDDLAALTDEAEDVHTYTHDPSLRCFHIRVDRLLAHRRPISLRLMARTGTPLVGYRGVGSEQPPPAPAGAPLDFFARLTRPMADGWDALIDLTPYLDAARGFELFRPNTTTLVELRLNREPLPLAGISDILRFIGRP